MQPEKDLVRRYLDSGSSEPLDPRAREALLAAYDAGYADPRRLHSPARQARLLLDNARAAAADALGVRDDEGTSPPREPRRSTSVCSACSGGAAGSVDGSSTPRWSTPRSSPRRGGGRSTAGSRAGCPPAAARALVSRRCVGPRVGWAGRRRCPPRAEGVAVAQPLRHRTLADRLREALVTELDRRGIAVASGLACTASALEPSHVLVAIGALTHGDVRVTFSPTTSEADVDELAAVLPEVLTELRARVAR